MLPATDVDPSAYVRRADCETAPTPTFTFQESIGHRLTVLKDVSSPPSASTTKTTSDATLRWAVRSTRPPLAGLIDTIRGYAGTGYRSSYGTPPSDWSIKSAVEIATALVGAGITPSRAVPIADGGIALALPPRLGRSARIEITNDEGIVLTMRAAEGAEPVYDEVAPEFAARRIAEFLAAS